jgi:prolyl 4-hydroxylase
MPATPHQNLLHYIRVYDGALPGELCQRLITSFGALQSYQRYNGRNLRRSLDDSEWTELNITRLSDAGFLQVFRSLIDAALERYNRDVGLAIPIPNTAATADLILKRYRTGGPEKFQLHFDAIQHVANRYLVMLWYLNDVEVGGETRFPQLEFSVRPKAGRLIVFPPYWMYQHEGTAPVSGDKYILSTYLLFEAPVPAAAKTP